MLNLSEQFIISAAVQQEEEALLDDGESGVDGHEGEKIGAEGIS